MSDSVQQPNTEVKNDQIQTEVINSNTPASAIPDITQDENWQKVREQRKVERKAREDAEARANQKAEEAAALKAALEALTNKPSNNMFNTSYQEDDSEDAKLDKLVEAKLDRLEKQREQQRKEREMKEAPLKIREKYNDFDSICSPENMDYVDYHHPELTAPFRYMPDGYDKWEAMYKATKKLLPNQSAKKDAAKIEKNLGKPGSMSTVNALQQDNPSIKLSEQRKAENWARMEKSRKGLS